MSWLDLAVKVVPDSLIQRAKALQETLRFEQVEKERQERLEEDIRRKRKGSGNGKGERLSRSGLTSSETIFGRRGPNRSIMRRPIGNTGAGTDIRVAVGYLRVNNTAGAGTLTVTSGDLATSITVPFANLTERNESSTVIDTRPGQWEPAPPADQAIAHPPPSESNGNSTYGDYAGSGSDQMAAWAAGGPRYVVNQQKDIVQETDLEARLALCLPVSGESTMLVYLSKGIRSTINMSASNYSEGGLVLVGTTTDTFGTSYEYAWVPEVDNPTGPTVTQGISTYFYDVKCFLVGRDHAKQVTAPSGLITSLSRFVPNESVAPSRLNLALEAYTLLGSGDLSVDFPPTYSYSSTQRNEFDPPFWIYNIKPPVQYGIGAYTTTSHSSNSATLYGSPGVYSVLAQSVTDFPTYAAGYANYEVVSAAISGPKPAKLLADCGFTGSCAGDRLEWGVSTSWPATLSTALPQSSFSDSFADYYTRPEDQGTVGLQIQSWDWGNPVYCAEQLLSLGFTEADLTP